jgi:hypothetical protein
MDKTTAEIAASLSPADQGALAYFGEHQELLVRRRGQCVAFIDRVAAHGIHVKQGRPLSDEDLAVAIECRRLCDERLAEFDYLHPPVPHESDWEVDLG